MSNSYFNASGVPAQYARGLSAPMRNEYGGVEAGFDLLPDPNIIWGGAANYYADSGSVNNIVISGLNSNVSAWYDGLEFVVKVAYTNTDTVQIVPGALAAKTIVDQSGNVLTPNAFYAGQIITLRYIASSDKVQFVTTSDAAAAASAASAAASAASAAAHVLFISPTVRTSNSVLTNSDAGKRLLLTGTFTQTFDTSGMTSGWSVLIKNNDSANGTSRITLSNVDGVPSVLMYPNEERIVSYDGSILRTSVIHPFIVELSVTELLSRPTGYSYFEGEFWSAGAGGGGGYVENAGVVKSGGGGGGAGGYTRRKISNSEFGATALVTIGGGGNGGASGSNGSNGGSTSFGTIISVAGGGGGNSGGTGGSQDTGSAGGGVPGGALTDTSDYYFNGATGGYSKGSTSSSGAGAGRPHNGGGGGGGGGESAINVLWNPADGGSRNYYTGNGGIAGSSNASAPTSGSNGGAFQGGGGGGSAQSANGANGGSGGTASGGGGGGSARTGFTAGSGGNGGNGMSIIWGVA